MSLCAWQASDKQVMGNQREELYDNARESNEIGQDEMMDVCKQKRMNKYVNE